MADPTNQPRPFRVALTGDFYNANGSSKYPDLGLSVKVPDQIDIQRAREVLDEVRRRLGDPSRPMFELDYLERLIRSY